MAEMTKDMYGAIGKVGNMTYYQRLGKYSYKTPSSQGKSAVLTGF